MSAPRRSISVTPISSWGATQPGPDIGKVQFCRRLDNSVRDEVIRSCKHDKDKTGYDAEEKYRDAMNKVRAKYYRGREQQRR
uniref:Uncharacterized protein n=1 Tax=Nelumbo nucifera TaxID=4432 RepID=A0A822YCL6_NELNU|nr:TPA_asm: hypothetical protein HUJ06_028716 [Nelumbo nucifera]